MSFEIKVNFTLSNIYKYVIANIPSKKDKKSKFTKIFLLYIYTIPKAQNIN